MRKKDKRDLTAILQRMIGEESSAMQIADELGKAYSTMQGEINSLADPETRNKLGIITVIEICQLCDFAPLLEFLSRMGGYLPPVEMPESKPGAGDLHRDLTRISKLYGALADRIEAATDEHGPGGAKIMAAETAEIITVGRAVEAGLAALMEDAKAATVVHIGEKRRGG